MKTPYSHLSLLTIPMVGAHETRSLGRSLLARADAKKLPARLHGVVAAVRAAFVALDAKLRRRTRRAGTEQDSSSGAEVDARADRLLAVVHGVLTNFARLPDEADPARVAAARVLLAAFFPEGLAAIVQASYRAQYERMVDLFAIADRKQDGHAARVELCGLTPTLEALRALLPAYAEGAGVVATGQPEGGEFVRDEMVALREAILTYARRVEGDAAGGSRNAQLRARRLLLPLREVSEEESWRRIASKSAKEKARGEKPADDTKKDAAGGEAKKEAGGEVKKDSAGEKK